MRWGYWSAIGTQGPLYVTCLHAGRDEPVYGCQKQCFSKQLALLSYQILPAGIAEPPLNLSGVTQLPDYKSVVSLDVRNSYL